MRYCVYVFVLLAFLACDHDSFSPLTGKWQLKTVEKSGQLTPVDTVWYNFQSKSIFSIQIYDSARDTVIDFIGLRTQESNRLSIKIIFQLDGLELSDFTDWHDINRSFTIDKMNRKQLMLQSDEGHLYSFRKF